MNDGVRIKNFVKQSALTKAAAIFVLLLIFSVPLSMVRGILSERQGTRNEAIKSITESWGGEQLIAGPLLVVPYTLPAEKVIQPASNALPVEGKPRQHKAYFLPKNLNVVTDINPEKRYRGIFDATVYQGTFQIQGEFAPVAGESFLSSDAEPQWDKTFITLPLKDLRGVNEVLQIEIGGQKFELHPGTKLKAFPTGVNSVIGDLGQKGTALTFSIRLTINGSDSLSFAPLGEQNSVTVKSNWPDPSFDGKFLPSERKITPEGFSATWKVSHYATGFERTWTDSDLAPHLNQQKLCGETFRVRFVSPVDTYRGVERALKYGAMIMLLTFTVFFLFEVTSGSRVHVIHYGLVGAALCLFFSAFLALAEILAFGVSYTIAAALCIVMITCYSKTFLRSILKTVTVAVSLASTYLFLYVILQLQDYSLLVGTAGLFISLGTVMYVTRNIDWYAGQSMNEPTPDLA